MLIRSGEFHCAILSTGKRFPRSTRLHVGDALLLIRISVATGVNYYKSIGTYCARVSISHLLLLYEALHNGGRTNLIFVKYLAGAYFIISKKVSHPPHPIRIIFLKKILLVSPFSPTSKHLQGHLKL